MIATLPAPTSNALDEVHSFISACRTPRLRTMAEFAEQEIVLPADGPFPSVRYRLDRAPFARAWFDAIDTGSWIEYLALGPTQSGKTLQCFIIPTLYHLFELNETVICGVPDQNMVRDKWMQDLLPAIERMSPRYRDLLPRTGSGSRGGTISEAVRFRNGATLRFMTGGGGDKSRAGFTARVLVITELDGFAASSTRSHEANKLAQLEGRVRAFGSRARIYKECTVTVESNPIWQGYEHGTRATIVLPCPHCQRWVAPEREHLVGWQDASDEIDAMENAAFMCPECSALWDEDHRRQANDRFQCVLRGQEVTPEGSITGAAPRTTVYSLRWSAANNLLISSGDIGRDEYRALRDPDRDNAERRMSQFVWALPYRPDLETVLQADVEQIKARALAGLPRGFCPPDTAYLTAGIDIAHFLMHYTILAWSLDGSPHVVEHSACEVRSRELGLLRAVLIALRELHDSIFQVGWPTADPDDDGSVLVADQVFIDAGDGNVTDAVLAFCDEQRGSARGRDQVYRPIFARAQTKYYEPHSVGKSVRAIGDGYFHARTAKHPRLWHTVVNTDHYKSRLHQHLTTSPNQPGALTLFEPENPNEHLAFAQHLTSEEARPEFDERRGRIVRWHHLSRHNHWFDATAYAIAAGHSAGVRLIETDEARRIMAAHRAHGVQRDPSKMSRSSRPVPRWSRTKTDRPRPRWAGN